MISRRIVLGLVAGLVPIPALAQDDSLYPEPSAPDASFLRVIAPDAESVRIGDRRLTMPDNGISPYVEVSPGTLDITVGDGSTEVQLGANMHYTFLATASEPLIEDAMKDSPAQADLLLYNASGQESVDLHAVEADQTALSGVTSGSHAGVGLKAPLTLTFEVRADGETLATLEPVDLRRGTATTILVTGDPDTLETTTVTSHYD